MIGPLSFVLYNRYKFRLVAVDGGEPRRSGSLEVVVTLTDVNDNSPTFARASLEARVREGTSVGTVVCRATASDADVGLNGELRYRFTDETRRQHGATFHIRPDTGAVVVIGALDYETRREYSLYVLATDRAGVDGSALTGMISIVVRVEDINDHAPDIEFNFRSQASGIRPSDFRQRDVIGDDRPFPAVKVDRAADVGSFVAHVTVRDADDGENGRFRCVLLSSSGGNRRKSNNATGNRFALRQIYETEYTIVTAARFDDEPAAKRDVVQLDVYCADGGRPTLTSEASLLVAVGDDLADEDEEDMLRDVFRKKVIQIAVAESVPIGTGIYCPRPSDADRNSVSKSVYRLTDVSSTSGWPALRFLDVDATSGVVRTTLTLDRKYQCRLEVDLWRDVDGSSSHQSAVRLSIVVVDVTRWRHSYAYDDGALVGNADVDYEFSVAESSPPPTYVGSVSATDLCLPTSNNEHDRVVYDLVGKNSSTLSKLFHVGAGNGRLTTVTPLDREQRPDYTLLVLARLSTDVVYVDAAGCQSPAVRRMAVIEALARLRVTVSDLNDNSPVFEFPRPGNDVITLSPEAAPGHVISRVIARDEDAGHNASISYHIESHSAWSKAFRVDHTTGH